MLRILTADDHAIVRQGLKRIVEKSGEMRVVAEVVKKLNHRPRRWLDYRTPHEVFMKAKRGAVAM